MKRDVDDIIAASPWGYRRRARLSLNYQPKTQQLQIGFRKANSSEIVDVVQCPVLVPAFGALLPAVRECLSGLQSLRQLGHVELVQADNGPLMVLRHTAALPAADKEKLERFSQSHGLSCISPRKARYWNIFAGSAPVYVRRSTLSVQSARLYSGQRRRKPAHGAYGAGMAGYPASGSRAGSLLRHGQFYPAAGKTRGAGGWRGRGSRAGREGERERGIKRVTQCDFLS